MPKTSPYMPETPRPIPFFYHLLRILAAPFLKWYFPIEVVGLENIPNRGAAILASNHESFLDHFLVPAVVPRTVQYIGKAELFSGPFGFLMTRVLRRGKLLGIYPEGTRSPNGKLYKGKTGVIRLALAAGCPVMPVAMIGSYEAMPKGIHIPRRGKVTIKIGQPLVFSDPGEFPEAVLDEEADHTQKGLRLRSSSSASDSGDVRRPFSAPDLGELGDQDRELKQRIDQLQEARRRLAAGLPYDELLIANPGEAANSAEMRGALRGMTDLLMVKIGELTNETPLDEYAPMSRGQAMRAQRLSQLENEMCLLREERQRLLIEEARGRD